MKHYPLRRFIQAAGYLLGVHVAALLFFFVFRLILFISTDYEFAEEIQGDWALQAVAFVKGLWFDNVIACYILILPLVVLWIASLCNYTAKWLYLFTGGWFIALYSLAFIISAANIPYFAYFFKVINSSIFNWFGYAGTTAGMIFGETSYYFPIALGLVSILLWGVGIHLGSKKCYEWSLKAPQSLTFKERGLIFVAGAACVGLCLFGIRGRLGYNPIKVSQAYYCEDPFLNQLGVNPVFNLLTSTLDDNRKENRHLRLMPDAEAIAQVQQLLNREGLEGISPIAREVKPDTLPLRRNVVLVFMESMSAQLMKAFGQTKNLTPFLDSLYQESMSFNNIYSAGIHTNHGLYSTLYSFPTIMKRNAMKGSVIPLYSGLPTVLKDNGYHTLFFMTHESQYDNMNAFFRTNGFDEIYAEENYPKEKIANHFGVQDDFLYEYALPILNERAESGQPFFAALLSISNHPPYIIPPYFHPKSGKIEEQIVEYADWSIRQFMNEARKQPWFDHTVFVFVGDHDKLVGTPENEMPESYNHVPLLVYGKGITPCRRNDLGGQIDIAPTLLGMLNIGYTQNNFGIDLLKEKRPCIFYTADNLIAARDTSRLYIHSPESGQEFHYELREGKHRFSDDKTMFSSLKNYVFSMLQSTEHLVRQNKTVDHPTDNP
ncbi:MAG: sulfatase-like hydrolase/transferase [Bacteroides sp.]|nr:sulfatase-like hydrolase/transferase [Bacteroides sp.]